MAYTPTPNNSNEEDEKTSLLTLILGLIGFVVLLIQLILNFKF